MNEVRKNNLLLDLLTLLITCVLIFSLLEAGFRVKAYFSDRKILSKKIVQGYGS
jgi:hypothetical protein